MLDAAAAAASAAAAEAALLTCMVDVCKLNGNNATAIIRQGYQSARKFRHIDNDILEEIFDTNATLTGM